MVGLPVRAPRNAMEYTKELIEVALPPEAI
jgi:hypothetical protein